MGVDKSERLELSIGVEHGGPVDVERRRQASFRR
jgi:hypothetical protein